MTTQKNFEDIKKMTFEQALDELEDITEKFEDGSYSLEKAVTLYERGIALKEHCEQKLQEAKKKIESVKVSYSKKESGEIL